MLSRQSLPSQVKMGLHLPLQKMVVPSLSSATLKPTCFIQKLLIKQQVLKLPLTREK